MKRLAVAIAIALSFGAADAGRVIRGTRTGPYSMQITIGSAPLTGTPTAYKFAIGTVRGGPYTVTYTTPDASTLTYTFTGLVSGTYYGAVATVNATGVGDYGQEVTKTVP